MGWGLEGGENYYPNFNQTVVSQKKNNVKKNNAYFVNAIRRDTAFKKTYNFIEILYILFLFYFIYLIIYFIFILFYFIYNTTFSTLDLFKN